MWVHIELWEMVALEQVWYVMYCTVKKQPFHHRGKQIFTEFEDETHTHI